MPSACGFFGKLPARGDFVRSGLKRDFVAQWDNWLSAVLPAALEATGDGWLQAPVWRFCLAPGVCGAEAVTGLLFPSADKVGRRFPLTLAWVGDTIDDASLAVAERLGRAAIDEALPPDELADRLGTLSIGTDGRRPVAGSLWWRECGAPGSPDLPALPDTARFVMMITGDVG